LLRPTKNRLILERMRCLFGGDASAARLIDRGNIITTFHTDEPARFLSRVGGDIYSTDFAENLLFQTLVNKAEIVEVFRIVRFKSYPIFNE
jgi:hypothetical protein